ncbi:MAG: NAD(P)H-hydrate epimerase [Candidatus Ratteibacteria bacterium]|nr:NAD(P)H-hydrate epimerase [Candidatus Ratteibacteria bacterium]
MTICWDRETAVSVEEMQAFDRWAVKMGLSPLVLMENAGRAVALAAGGILPPGEKARVAIFAGSGNNGGDGFVAGRYLRNRGIKTDIFLLSPEAYLKNEARTNFGILTNLKISCHRLENQSVRQKVLKNLKDYDLIIDALLGTGFKKPIKGNLLAVIKAINQAGRPVIAVDIPSGMDGNTGEVFPLAVKAGETITMAAAKKGFLNPAARDYLGEVKIADLGIAFRRAGG